MLKLEWIICANVTSLNIQKRMQTFTLALNSIQYRDVHGIQKCVSFGVTRIKVNAKVAVQILKD